MRRIVKALAAGIRLRPASPWDIWRQRKAARRRLAAAREALGALRNAEAASPFDPDIRYPEGHVVTLPSGRLAVIAGGDPGEIRTASHGSMMVEIPR